MSQPKFRRPHITPKTCFIYEWVRNYFDEKNKDLEIAGMI